MLVEGRQECWTVVTIRSIMILMIGRAGSCVCSFHQFPLYVLKPVAIHLLVSCFLVINVDKRPLNSFDPRAFELYPSVPSQCSNQSL